MTGVHASNRIHTGSWRFAAAFALVVVAGCSPSPATSSGTPAGSRAGTIAPRVSTLPTSQAAPSAAPTEKTVGTFEVNGRTMTIECRGTGTPTLVFLVGSDASRTQMRDIEDAFVDRVRVCEYERNDPPDALEEDRVNDLAALLKAAAIAPPYLLVGQSVGGDIAWLYASRRPTEVAGFLVMNAGPFQLDPKVMAKVWTPQEMAEEFPPAGSAKAKNAITLQTAKPPPGVPYVVMLSTIEQCGSPTDICGRFYPAYEAWGRELAGRSPNGRFVQVPAPHDIFATRADAVISEIEQLLGEAPTASP